MKDKQKDSEVWDLVGKYFSDGDHKHTLDPNLTFKVDCIIKDVYEIDAFEFGTKYKTIDEWVKEIEQWSDKLDYVYGAHYPYGNKDDWRCNPETLISKIKSGKIIEITKEQFESLKEK